MKKQFTSFFTLVMVTFMYSKINAQLTVNAGSSFHLCSPISVLDSIQLGGSPSALGGIEPYTFSWSIEPVELWFAGSGVFFHASDLLGDTTSSNPFLLEVYPLNSLSNNYFILSVTDSNGDTQIDSIKITASSFIESFMNWSININSGDSIFIYQGPNITGGIGPLNYEWQPNHGLSDPTIVNNFWAKPEYSINYFVSATDSMGCLFSGNPFIFVEVTSLGLFSNDKTDKINFYPNPVTDVIYIESNLHFEKAQIFDLSGKQLDNLKLIGNEIKLNSMPAGHYILLLSTKNNEHQESIIFTKF